MKLIVALFRKLQAVSCLALVLLFAGKNYCMAEVNQLNEYLISGTVTDAASREHLPGVTAIVKGTSIGTITDVTRQYSIQVTLGQVLKFSYIGYLI